MSSAKSEQREENRRTVSLGIWAVAVCFSLGFGRCGLAQNDLTVLLPASWAFSGHLISITGPSNELIAAGMLNVTIESIGFDQSLQSTSLFNPDASSISNEVFLGGSAAEFLPALDYSGPVADLALPVGINVGSFGLLNLSSASVTNLNPMSLKIDNDSLTSAAIVPAATGSKSTSTAPT